MYTGRLGTVEVDKHDGLPRRLVLGHRYITPLSRAISTITIKLRAVTTFSLITTLDVLRQLLRHSIYTTHDMPRRRQREHTRIHHPQSFQPALHPPLRIHHRSHPTRPRGMIERRGIVLHKIQYLLILAQLRRWTGCCVPYRFHQLETSLVRCDCYGAVGVGGEIVRVHDWVVGCGAGGEAYLAERGGG